MNYETARYEIDEAKIKIRDANEKILEVLKEASPEFIQEYIESLHDISKQLFIIYKKL